MRDNKASTSFLQEHFVPKLRTFFDSAPQFNLKLAQVPGIKNPAADYLSRLKVAPVDRNQLKLTDSIKQADDEKDFHADPSLLTDSAATPPPHNRGGCPCVTDDG